MALFGNILGVAFSVSFVGAIFVGYSRLTFSLIYFCVLSARTLQLFELELRKMSKYVDDPHLTFFFTCYISITMQIKAGDVRVLANTSFILVKKDWSSEIRLHAFKMLQVCPHFLAILIGRDFVFQLVTLSRASNV